MSLCCHVGEGRKADEEGLVAFTWFNLSFIKLLLLFLYLLNISFVNFFCYEKIAHTPG